VTGSSRSGIGSWPRDLAARGERVLGVLQAARLHNGVAVWLLALVGCRRGGLLPDAREALAVGAGVVLLAAGSQFVNDILDLPADRRNRPRRPLPRGRTTLSDLRRATLVAIPSGLACGLLARPDWLPWWLLWSLLGPGYSLLAKGRGWIAPLWTALTIASFYLPGASRDGIDAGDGTVFFMASYFIFLREIVKSLEDVRGDLAAGYRSLGPGSGPGARGLLALALPLLVVAGAAVLAPAASAATRAAGLAFAGILLVALAGLASPRWRSLHRAGAWLKAGSFCGLLTVMAWSP
jgi:geranylgeranylglycerol-phosphate geranylgeranyltransferase